MLAEHFLTFFIPPTCEIWLICCRFSIVLRDFVMTPGFFAEFLANSDGVSFTPFFPSIHTTDCRYFMLVLVKLNWCSGFHTLPVVPNSMTQRYCIRRQLNYFCMRCHSNPFICRIISVCLFISIQSVLPCDTHPISVPALDDLLIQPSTR